MVEEDAQFLGAILAEPSLRKSFSLKEKREFVRDVDAIVATGLSRCKACLQLRMVLRMGWQRSRPEDWWWNGSWRSTTRSHNKQ